MSGDDAPKGSSGDAFSNCVVDHHRLLKNEEYTDVSFVIDEKASLHAHYYVLKHRLPQVLDDSGGTVKKPAGGKKKAKVQIKIKKSEMITQAAMERVLVYVYCGEIDYSDYTPFKAIEVMRAASVYKMARLMQMNEKYLQENLTMKNIFALLKFSDQMNVQEAKEICIEFALTNGDFFTSSSAENLGFKLYQEVTALLLKAHTSGGAPKELKKREVSAADTIVQDFAALYGASDSSGDVTFVIMGEDVKAHRAVLADQSKEMAELVMPADDDKDWTKKIVLDTKYSRISPGAFQAMLKFFYYTDKKISMIHATELVSFAKDYKLDKFYAVIERVIGGQDVSVETVLNVLDVAYHPLMDENPSLQNKLKEEGLNFVVANIDRVNFEPLITMPPVIATHILQSLQKKIGKNWRLVMEGAAAGSNIRIDDLKAGAGANWAKGSPRKEKKDKADKADKADKEEKKDAGDTIVASPSKSKLTESKPEKTEKKETGKDSARKDDKRETKDEKPAKESKGEEKPKEEGKEGEKKDGEAKVSKAKSSKHESKAEVKK